MPRGNRWAMADFPVETGTHVNSTSVYPDQATKKAVIAKRVKKYRAAQGGGNRD